MDNKEIKDEIGKTKRNRKKGQPVEEVNTSEVKEEVANEINKVEEIIEETEKNEESVSKENELINEEESEEEKQVAEAKKNRIPTSSIIMGIICIVLIIVLLVINFSSTKINLKNFNDCFADKEATLTLPNNYLFAEDGQIFKKENGILFLKGAFAAVSISEEEYDSAMLLYAENMPVETLDNEDFKITKVTQEAEDIRYDYYFMFKDGITIQFVFDTIDQNIQQQIVYSLDY